MPPPPSKYSRRTRKLAQVVHIEALEQRTNLSANINAMGGIATEGGEILFSFAAFEATPTEDITVTYQTVDGTATSTGATPDYSPVSGSFTLSATTLSVSIGITILSDTDYEPGSNEQFTIQYTAVCGSESTTGSVTGDITDDDTPTAEYPTDTDWEMPTDTDVDGDSPTDTDWEMPTDTDVDGDSPTDSDTTILDAVDDGPLYAIDIVDLTIPTQTLLGNDDVPAQATITISFTQPANGTINLAGNSLIYNATNDWEGLDTFSYHFVADGISSDTALVSIEVKSPRILLEDVPPPGEPANPSGDVTNNPFGTIVSRANKLIVVDKGGNAFGINHTWTVPDHAIDSLDPDTGIIDELNQAEKTGVNPIRIHWMNPGNKQVSVAFDDAKGNNVTLATNAVVDVPDINFHIVPAGNPPSAINLFDDFQSDIPEFDDFTGRAVIMLGDMTSSQSRVPGMESRLIPGSTFAVEGKFGFLNVLSSQSIRRQFSDGRYQRINNSNAHDGFIGGPAWNDSPSFDLDYEVETLPEVFTSANWYSRDDKHSLYLMYKDDAGGVWVPIQVATWWWKVEASASGPFWNLATRSHNGIVYSTAASEIPAGLTATPDVTFEWDD